MASRTGASADTPSLNQAGSVTTTGNVQNTNSTTNQNSSSSSSGTKNASSTTTNFTPSSLAALELLIKQLLGGGTNQQAQENAFRQQEIGAVQGIRSQYGKSDAFADAQGAQSQQQRLAFERILPSLVRSAEGAGTSQNSLRALLLQDAANKAAESSAAIGLKASVDYGNIQGSLSNTLESLTRPQNTVVNNLLSALNIAKGAVVKSDSTENSSSSSNTNTTSNTTGTVTTQGQEVRAPLNSGSNSFNSNDSWGGTPSLTNPNEVTAADVYAYQQSLGGSGGANYWNGVTF